MCRNLLQLHAASCCSSGVSGGLRPSAREGRAPLSGSTDSGPVGVTPQSHTETPQGLPRQWVQVSGFSEGLPWAG